MPTYKTPGVYVEEISTLPPSVAGVSTAIPAFIGCTEKGPSIARITTMLEYRELFGSAHPTGFTVATATDAAGATTVASVAPEGDGAHPAYLLYYSVAMFFRNGGGSCYIVSVGDYNAPPERAAFEAGIASLEKRGRADPHSVDGCRQHGHGRLLRALPANPGALREDERPVRHSRRARR